MSTIWIVSNDKHACSLLAGALADVGTPRTLPYAALGDHRFPFGATILFDVDLSDGEVVATVREALKRAEAANPVFAIDVRTRLHKVQADALGAVAVVARPFDVKAIKAVLKRLAARRQAAAGGGDPTLAAARRPERRLDPRDPSQSVGLGGAVLTRLFDGLLAGKAFDPATVEAASEAIEQSVDAVGLDGWLRTMKEHHTGTFLHCLLVTGIATRFAVRLGLSAEDRRVFTAAAILHDVGKARIPLEILDKPGALTAAEFHIMKKHPVIGAAYLARQGTVEPRILDMVLHHHEYLNGTGYPDGLTADKLPRLTRALTIADVFAALVEERRYKLPMPADKALGVLAAMVAEGRLDRDLVAAFAAVAAEIGHETPAAARASGAFR